MSRGEAGVTKRDWDKANERQPDPARMLRDPRESRGERALDELVQLASIYEPTARRVQQRIESGAKVYPFEQHRLDDWKRLMAEIARRRGLYTENRMNRGDNDPIG